jgi:hypothetical protein
MQKTSRHERRESAAIPLIAAAVWSIVEPDEGDIDGPPHEARDRPGRQRGRDAPSDGGAGVQDGYAALKELLTRPYTRVPISMMAKPPSVVL